MIATECTEIRIEGRVAWASQDLELLDFLPGMEGARSVNCREEREGLAIPLSAVSQAHSF